MMSIFTHLLALSGLLALLLLYKLWRNNHQNNSNKGKSAPEPSGARPLVGHLHLLGGQVPLYRIFGGLADEYGPVFGLRVGLHKVLVVSSWEAVKDCLTTNDKILAKRPASRAAVYLGFANTSFGFTDGPYWREMRKLGLQGLLSARRLETLKHVRESEIDTAIRELYKEHPGKVVDIGEWFVQVTSNMLMMMLAGKRYTNSTETVEVRSVREHIKELINLFGQFTVADAFPFPPLSWIDFHGHLKSMKRIKKGLSTIFERWIDEHVRRDCQSDEQDFIDVMLLTVDDERFMRFGHTRETIIKATLTSLIIGGNDTTSIHMTWLLSLLLNNRRVLQRAQEEIDAKCLVLKLEMAL
ncbi:Xanthotoxin 5-hydroxylase CYP82C4 [Sesamum alatum]|uniref:Xanthotoxin 5-hydroxylase CYP82C4 n=1 Tax=Sesamum alatum TaxID=300844 RepID=A0AAE2D057_9LAMI|nr:Xanthotoxin 5-hydroxylase CYP82C4 [Sesamum alatum]